MKNLLMAFVAPPAGFSVTVPATPACHLRGESEAFLQQARACMQAAAAIRWLGVLPLEYF
jgi:hypothetical protein